MKEIIIICMMTMFFVPNAIAASVYVKDDNVFYANNNKTLQITSLGRDREPVLESKGNWIYFIRGTPGKWENDKYHPAKEELIENGILRDELWKVRTDGTNAKMLFQNKGESAIDLDPDYNCASINNIQLSPDGSKIYFETPEWVTSAGLHVMNSDGTSEKLLGGGNDTKIVISASEIDPKYGTCHGYIVTDQHRYWWFGGSYDWYYLFTPDFKEVGPLGDDFAYFTEMGDIIYTDHSEETIKKSEKLNVKN